MAIIFLDTFTEAAVTELTLHTPDTGTSWVLEEQTISGTMQVKTPDNEVQPANDSGTGERVLYSANPSNVLESDVSMTLKNWTSQDLRPFAMFARFSDVNNYYSAGTYAPVSTADKRIFKKVGGVVTELASGDFGVSTDQVYTFEIRNAAKRFLRNGGLLISTTDNELSGAGKSGLAAGNIWAAVERMNSSWNFDDFTVDEIVPPIGGSEGAAMYHHLQNLGVYA